MTGRSDYYERQEARKERLEERAEKLEAEADRRSKAGWEALRAIPFGQPILVGHHSEQRDRNYRGRACGNIDKSVELSRKAGDLASRAASIGKTGRGGSMISSDAPDAAKLIAEKVAKLEATQAMMKAANKVVRAFWKGGYRADNSEEELGRYFEKMAEAGIASPAVARSLLKPDFANRIGFADYQLTNNNANIRRLKGRLKDLQRVAAEFVETKETTVETKAGEIEVVENVDENRVQIIFPGKPSADVRKVLKSRGFRWAPSQGAWQRQLNANGRWAAEQVVKELSAG